MVQADGEYLIRKREKKIRNRRAIMASFPKNIRICLVARSSGFEVEPVVMRAPVALTPLCLLATASLAHGGLCLPMSYLGLVRDDGRGSVSPTPDARLVT